MVYLSPDEIENFFNAWAAENAFGDSRCPVCTTEPALSDSEIIAKLVNRLSSAEGRLYACPNCGRMYAEVLEQVYPDESDTMFHQPAAIDRVSRLYKYRNATGFLSAKDRLVRWAIDFQNPVLLVDGGKHTEEILNPGGVESQRHIPLRSLCNQCLGTPDNLVEHYRGSPSCDLSATMPKNTGIEVAAEDLTERCPQCKSINVETMNSILGFTTMKCKSCGFRETVDNIGFDDWRGG